MSRRWQLSWHMFSEGAVWRRPARRQSVEMQNFAATRLPGTAHAAERARRNRCTGTRSLAVAANSPNSMLLVSWHELLDYGLAEQRRRQQTLRQHEVVELHAIEIPA